MVAAAAAAAAAVAPATADAEKPPQQLVAWELPPAAVPHYTSQGVAGLAATTLSDGRVCLAGGGHHRYPDILVTVLQGSQWLDLDAAADGEVPAGRAGHTLTPGPSPGTFLVFGGQTATEKSSDLYLALVAPGLECLSWRMLGTNPQPIPVDKPPPKGKRQSGSQEQIPRFPPPRAWHASCLASADGGKRVLLVHGGIGADGAVLSDLWSFDFGLDRWTELQPTGAPPMPRCHHTLCAVGGDASRAVLIGGYDGKARSRTVASLSLVPPAAWSVVETAVPALGMHCALAAPAAAALAGVLLPPPEPPSPAAAPTPAPTAAAAAAAKNKTPLLLWPGDEEAVYVFGGVTAAGALNAEVYAISGSGATHAVCADAGRSPPPPRCAAATTALGGCRTRLLVIGGSLTDGSRARDAHVLNLCAQPVTAAAAAAEAAVAAEAAAAEDAPPPPAPRVELPNGDSYAGGMSADGEREGSGTCTFANGDCYAGAWAADAPHGRGEMVYVADGAALGGAPPLARYSGEWRHGVLHGMGEAVFAEAAAGATAAADAPMLRSYSGGWVDGVPQGQGRGVFSDGGEHTGLWEGGVPHGRGQLRKDGSVFHGEWQQGQLLSCTQEAPKWRYEGEVRALLREGWGQCHYADGTVYIGMWRNGRKNGQGEQRDGVSREVYKGKFVGGERCGAGTCLWPSGDSYEGLWRAGRRHRGVMQFADGTAQGGEWPAG